MKAKEVHEAIHKAISSKHNQIFIKGVNVKCQNTISVGIRQPIANQIINPIYIIKYH